MARPRLRLSAWLIGAAACCLVVGVTVIFMTRGNSDSSHPPSPSPAVRLAVLGNSDSHAYQDSISFPLTSPMRGGSHRAGTFQWTEHLAQFRAAEVNQGEWGIHGYPPRVARVAGRFGVRLRTPRKQDFAYNFAVSRARCEHLRGALGQTAQLVRTLHEDPAAWDAGVVVLRIGINNLGRRSILDPVAASGLDATAHALIEECVGHIRDSVREIRDAHSTVRIVVVGLADNANWPPNHVAWQTRGELANVRALLDAFDGGLRDLVAATPLTFFFDDRAWFRERWGDRSPDGMPMYRPVCLGGLPITNTQGDGIEHTTLADGHAGTVLNAVWVQSMLQFIIERTGAALTPISDADLVSHLGRLRTEGSWADPDIACTADGATR